MNCNDSITDELEGASGYSNINRLSVLLLSFPKDKNRVDIDSYLVNPNQNTRVLQIKKKPNMPESKLDSTQSSKSNNFVREIIRRNRTEWKEIEIPRILKDFFAKRLGVTLAVSKSKDKKLLEFPDDSDYTRSSSTDSDQPKGSFDINFFNSIRNEDSEYSELMNQTKIQQRKQRSNSWDPDLLKTEQKEIKHQKPTIKHPFPEEMEQSRGNVPRSLYSFCSDRWSELYMGSTPTTKSTMDPKFRKKSLSFLRQAEKKEILNLFRIIRYLKKTVSIQSISLDPEIQNSNNTGLFKKIPLFSFVNRVLASNQGRFVLQQDFKSEEKLKQSAYLFILAISEPDPVYHKGFTFFLNFLNMDSDGLHQIKLLNQARAELKNKSLWVGSPILFRYHENDSFFKRTGQYWIWSYCENGLVDLKQKMMVFLSKNMIEAVNRYRLIQNMIQMQYNTYVYIITLLNRFVLRNSNFKYRIQRIKGDQKGTTDLFTPRTEMTYRIKQSHPYRSKWSNGTKSLQEHSKHFISEQKILFEMYVQVRKGNLQMMFEKLYQFCIDIIEKITQKWIYWSKVRREVEIKVKKNVYKLVPLLLAKLSKSVRFFFFPQSLRFFFTKGFHCMIKLLFLLSNSLVFSCVSFGTNPVQRSEIYIYELKGPNGRLCNQLFESIGFKIISLKKLNPFLLEESGTSNFVINQTKEIKRSPFFFNNIAKGRIDTLLTRKKSFDENGNGFHPVNIFQRSSLISAFYKANRLPFLNMNNRPNLWFDCNKRFPFYVERTQNTNSYFLYRQFLNGLFFRNKKVYLSGGKKNHVFGDRVPISLIDSLITSEVSKIFISKDFAKKGNQRDNLENSFNSLRQSDSVMRNLILKTCGTPSTEAEIVNLEKTYCQPFSDINMNLYDSEENHFHEYPNYNFNMNLADIVCSEKYLSFKNNKKGRNTGAAFHKIRRGLTLHRENFFSILLEKLNLFQMNMPNFFTLTGYKYLNSILIDLFSILSSRISIFQDIWDLSWQIVKIKLWPVFIRSEISSKWFHNCLLANERFQRNTKPSTHLRSAKGCAFFISTLFLLISIGYLVLINLVFVSRALRELDIKFKRLKPFLISSYVIEFQQLVDKYPMCEPNEFWLNSLFLIGFNQFGRLVEEIQGFIFGLNKIRLTSRVKPRRFTKKSFNILEHLTGIFVSINRNIQYISCISTTSKELYSLIRERKDVKANWIDDQIESWVETSDSIHEEERPFLVQLSALTTEKPILWSLTNRDEFSKNDLGYQMIEQPGAIYLRYLVDLHQKDLMNYELNTSRLAERRIFLAHSQTMTYPQTSYGSNRFHLPSRGKPFSLRLDLSPSRGILVIGSIGTGRSYLVKYLAKNSYMPFITVFVNKLRDKSRKFMADFYIDNSINIDTSDNIDMNKSDRIDDDRDRDLAMELEQLTWMNALTMDKEMKAEINRLSITLQFELARAMSPCIIWIPNIHDLDVNESNSLSLGLLVNHLSRDCARYSPRNILVIASTHIPQKVDPALIAPKRLNTCIKLRRLVSPQQRKYFFTLSSTKGFRLEKKMFHTNGFGSITMWPNTRDIVALTNEVLSISITQKKSIIDTNTIRSALHRQTWAFQSQLRLVQDHGILLYQIGRAVAQNLLISNCPIDPISIYLKKESCTEGNSYLYKWYFELGTSMKKLTILLYILSCSAGSVAQDLWSFSGDEQNRITSYALVENDYDLVHGLLEVEGALLGSSRIEKNCRQFENDRVTRMENGSYSIFDHRFLYENYESEFEEDPLDLASQQIEKELFNHIVWAPRLWHPWDFLYSERIFYDKEDELQENDSEFLQKGTIQYKTRDRFSKEKGFFQISQFIWDPADPLFFLFKDRPVGSVFSHRELFVDEEMSKALLTSQTSQWEHLIRYKKTRNFIKKKEKKHFEFVINRQRWLGTNGSFYNRAFRSNTLSESYHYLSNLFLSNRTLFDQMTNTLLRKRWLFPDEMKI
uniref:Ycf2 protein n=1 Tax=Cuscuta pedicellata TaxID=192827 RepID=A0A7H0DGY9_9ASTE|nr:Ycf2 protein [Cuscuta pedicellata]QNP08599.1 Ycf2 protein [Cuscuta pedicellata]